MEEKWLEEKWLEDNRVGGWDWFISMRPEEAKMKGATGV